MNNRPNIKQPIPPHGKKVFTGKIFDVYQWEQKLYDGSIKTFEKLRRPDTVGVLAITSDNLILITRESQPGKENYMSLPGGQIENGEEPEEAAKRELLEETGYTTNQTEFWFAKQPTSKIDYVVHFVIAKNCKLSHQAKLESGEKVEVQAVNFEQFYEHVLHPEFNDIELKLALLLAEKQNRLHEIKKLLSN
jgi:8-oxo-dGTP pyrophosphatase MutT (NUDIX family)